jgi:hypothetical protein
LVVASSTSVNIGYAYDFVREMRTMKKIAAEANDGLAAGYMGIVILFAAGEGMSRGNGDGDGMDSNGMLVCVGGGGGR